MHRERLAHVSQLAGRLHFRHPGLGATHHAEDGSADTRGRPFKDSKLRGRVVDPEAPHGMHQLHRDVAGSRPGDLVQVPNEEGRDEGGNSWVVGLGRLQVLPPGDTDLLSGSKPGLSQDIAKPRCHISRLGEETQRLAEDDLDGQPGDAGMDDSLVADEEDMTVVRTN